MEIEKQINSLKIDKNKIYYQEPMKKHTTFKIGGPAECLISIEKEEELKEILKLANQNLIPLTILGNGSNVLVSDKGIKGITLTIKIEKMEIQEKDSEIEITVGAGEKLGKLAYTCLKKEITGLEELSGIPGTIRRSHQNECRGSRKRNEGYCKNSKSNRLLWKRKRICKRRTSI